jgi:hypothetical protein
LPSKMPLEWKRGPTSVASGAKAYAGSGTSTPRDDRVVALDGCDLPHLGEVQRQRFLDVLNAPARFSDERTLQ